MNKEDRISNVAGKLSFFLVFTIVVACVGLFLYALFAGVPSMENRASVTDPARTETSISRSNFQEMIDIAEDNCSNKDGDAISQRMAFDKSLSKYNERSYYANEVGTPALGYPFPIEPTQIPTNDWCQAADVLKDAQKGIEDTIVK